MVRRQTSNDLEASSVQIWRIDLDESFGDLATLLSTDENRRADDIKLEVERNRFIRARGALRSILGNYLDLPGSELDFVQGVKGKPTIFQAKTDIEFNLTHCEGMALLAVTKSTPVGIDLERIRTRPSQLKIAKRMFSEAVFCELKKLSPDQLDTAFFKQWTELEARAKCVGEGIFSHERIDDEITTRHFTPQDGWIACVATSGVDISEMELKHFLYKK
jgi:4'-phosphopantetheinyl transferase